jgi:hypothetical protein
MHLCVNTALGADVLIITTAINVTQYALSTGTTEVFEQTVN